MELVQLRGLQWFWQHQVLRGVGGSGSRKYSALEGYGKQSWPIGSSILAWRTPSLTEKPGRPQSTGSQRVRQDQSDPEHINTRLSFFACGSSVPVRVKRGTAAWLVGTWQRHLFRDTDCLVSRSYGSIRVFFQASCSWRSEGLFGQSFSIALPIQALRGIPCLGTLSVVQLIRHIEEHPGWGPTL